MEDHMKEPAYEGIRIVPTDDAHVRFAAFIADM